MPGAGDTVAWARALDCATADDLAACLDGLCRRCGVLADELVALLVTVQLVPDEDLYALTLRASVDVEGVYAALDRARRHVGTGQ